VTEPRLPVGRQTGEFSPEPEPRPVPDPKRITPPSTYRRGMSRHSPDVEE
jgi:hypothetical protein